MEKLNNDFLKYWAKLNAQYSNLLYEVEEEVFYIYKGKGIGDFVSCTPLLSPREVIDLSPENLIDLNTYITKYFEQNSDKNRDVFGQNSAGFRANYGKDSKENRNNSEPIQVDFGLSSGLFLNKNDKLLYDIRKISQKIQKKTVSKRAKSTVKAKALENNAVIWHAQNDTEELQIILNRLNGLMGAINNLKNNVKTAQLKKKRNRFYKIASVVAFFSIGIVAVITINIRNMLQQKEIADATPVQLQFKQVANIMQPVAVAIDTATVLQFVELYEKQRNCKISEWRRNKIITAIALQPNCEIRNVIDSVQNKKY